MDKIKNAIKQRDIKSHNKTLKLVHLALVAGLFLLIFLVMRPFIVPLLWSIIFTIFLLPIFRLLEKRLSNRSHLAAFLITLLVITFLVGIIVPLFWRTTNEMLTVLKSLEGMGEAKSAEWVSHVESIPLIGPTIAPYLLEAIGPGFSNLIETLKTSQGSWLSLATKAVSNIASLLFSGFFSILSLYFLLANVSTLIQQIKNGALELGGESYLELLESIYNTVWATLRGILITALAQGALAGIAYFVAGVPFPILLTILTALASFIPFGPPVIYIPVAIGMYGHGYSWLEICIFLIWGVGVVSTVDNLLRPLFISQTTKLSFLLVLFGMIGGISTFGLLGMFIGPVIMVLAIHLWGDLLKNGKNRFSDQNNLETPKTNT